MIFGNPWMLMGIFVALVLSHGAVGYKAHQFGGNAARVVCERRVDDLQARYDEQARRIAELNRNWQTALDALVDQNSREAELRHAEEQELQARLEEYEASVGPTTDCIISQHDADRLR